MKSIITPLAASLLMFSVISSSAQSGKSFYKAADFTAENLFTENIEGPNIDRAGNILVVNFQKNGTIGSVDKAGHAELFVSLPEGSTGNSIMVDAAGNLFVADFTGHNILKVDQSTKAISVFCHESGFNQPNDLCLNKKGQLFASDPNWKEKTGKLWRIDPNGVAVLLAENMGTTNGLELSPDEKILYVNESVQRKIWKFDVDQAGGISNKRLFFEFSDFGLDGMKCDKKGNLYVTRHGKGTITILSPEGKFLRDVIMKGKKTSNLTFGGPDGKTCFVTLQDRKCLETFRSKIAGKNWK